MDPVAARRALRILKTANFASVFDRYTMPAILVVIARDLDVQVGQVAIAASTYFLAYGLMQPVWGMISDRFGVVRTMRLSATAGSLCIALAVFAPTLGTLVVARALGGAFFGALVPTSVIYAGGVFPDESRQRGLTALMTSNALGTTLSTALSGAMAASLGWRWVFALSLGFGATAAVCTHFLGQLPRSKRRSGFLVPMAAVLRSKYAVLLFAVVFLEGAGILGSLTFIPATLERAGHNTALSAATITLYGSSVLALSVVVGRLSARTPASVLIAIGATIGTVGAFVMVGRTSLAAGCLAAALLGATWAFSHSSLQTWATQVLPEQRATVVSLFAASLFAGNAVAAVVGGWFVDADRIDGQYLLCGGLLVLVGTLGSLSRRRWERAQ